MTYSTNLSTNVHSLPSSSGWTADFEEQVMEEDFASTVKVQFRTIDPVTNLIVDFKICEAWPKYLTSLGTMVVTALYLARWSPEFKIDHLNQEKMKETA